MGENAVARLPLASSSTTYSRPEWPAAQGARSGPAPSLRCSIHAQYRPAATRSDPDSAGFVAAHSGGAWMGENGGVAPNSTTYSAPE